MRQARPVNPAPPLGSVHSDELLPAREFCRRMGIAKAAWSALLHRGFPVIPCGKQRFVDGGAALAYFRALTDRQNGDGDGGHGE